MFSKEEYKRMEFLKLAQQIVNGDPGFNRPGDSAVEIAKSFENYVLGKETKDD